MNDDHVINTKRPNMRLRHGWEVNTVRDMNLLKPSGYFT
jgi:hypothetical protein